VWQLKQSFLRIQDSVTASRISAPLASENVFAIGSSGPKPGSTKGGLTGPPSPSDPSYGLSPVYGPPAPRPPWYRSKALAAVVVWAAARVTRCARPAALGLWAGVSWLTHVVLDYLGLDTHPPIGIMALWPLESGYHKAPWILFLDIGRTLEWATVRHDALAVAWEIVLLGPLLMASWRRRARTEA
jgi:hypothetical protein